MSQHHTLHPTPVSGPPCPTSMNTPSNRKASFIPVLPVYGADAKKKAPIPPSTFFETYEKELTRLLEAGVDTKTAVSTARTLVQAEQNQPTATTDILQGTTNPYPTSTLQGVDPLPVPQRGYNTAPTNPFASSGQPSQSIAHPGFVASTPVNQPYSGQQNPHWLNTQPPSTPHSGIQSTSCPSSVTSVAIDDKIRRAQQQQAMQAFGSVTIFCDRQRSGRFDDWAAHMESALDLCNFEEARKLRLMRVLLQTKSEKTNERKGDTMKRTRTKEVQATFLQHGRSANAHAATSDQPLAPCRWLLSFSATESTCCAWLTLANIRATIGSTPGLRVVARGTTGDEST
ncbi:hypothetical protein OUZ56_005615 [Daphnia magna]|uniref:Uncharacterized protein n=1 Tax=Daphnia magna TaxID=35525 RepID=A0ABQ9YTD0_9CRUS|nr:hypothetical protein OUZ56_005615 [Daphnia magna]